MIIVYSVEARVLNENVLQSLQSIPQYWFCHSSHLMLFCLNTFPPVSQKTII